MSSRRVLWLWAAGVFLVVALLYGPTLRGGFVYDSIAQVLYSDYIHTASGWVHGAGGFSGFALDCWSCRSD